MLVVQKLYTLHLENHENLFKSYLKTNTHGFPMKSDALQIEVCLKCKKYQNDLIIKINLSICLTKHATLVLKLNWTKYAKQTTNWGKIAPKLITKYIVYI